MFTQRYRAVSFRTKIFLFVTFCCVSAFALDWERFASKSDDWYRSAEGAAIAGNILSWESIYGSWPKNTNTTDSPYTGDPADLHGTFDNNATTGEMRFLARAFRVTQQTRYKEAFLKAFDGILVAQYPNGGWPQYYPLSPQYHRHITFNDGSMEHVMEMLQDIYTLPDYEFVDAKRRKAAKKSFDLGVECILKCQVKVNGKLTVWCAQHDENTLKPITGRAYELPSLSGSESVGVLELLMSLKNPGPEVVRAIEAGAAWFESAKLTGISVQRIAGGDRIVVPDTNAPPLWARFYDIETNRPMFSGRDGVKKFNFAEIELERRRGYRWYGDWGLKLEKDYAKWKEQRRKDSSRGKL